MSHFFRLAKLADYSPPDFQRAIEAAPRAVRLRDAAATVIAAIHGLPEVMGAELSQLDIYLGRAGACPGYIRGRWKARKRVFEHAPSTCAIIALRAKTTLIREESWERSAQRIINRLTYHKALCCSNALTGDSGRWPDIDETVIYVVSRLRRGKVGIGMRHSALNAALDDLLHSRHLTADVIVEVGKMILHPERADDHVVISPS